MQKPQDTRLAEFQIYVLKRLHFINYISGINIVSFYIKLLKETP